MYRILVYYTKNGKINRFVVSRKTNDEGTPIIDFSLHEVLEEIEELFSIGVGLFDLFPRKDTLQLHPNEITKIEIFRKGQPMI